MHQQKKAVGRLALPWQQIVQSRWLRVVVSSLLFCFVASYLNGRYFVPMLGAWLCHELGHLLAAHFLKVKIRLTSPGLLGIGLNPDLCCQGRRESILAAAGPLVNLGLAYLCFRLQGWGWQFTYFYEANLVLALGNLLPVMPLDGGKIVRGILSRYVSWLWLTKLLVYLGQILSLVITIAIFWFDLNLWLMLLPLAIYVLAWLDDRNCFYVLIQALLATNCRQKNNRIIRVSGNLTIAQALRKLSPGYQNIVALPGRQIWAGQVLEAWLEGRGGEPLRYLA